MIGEDLCWTCHEQADIQASLLPSDIPNDEVGFYIGEYFILISDYGFQDETQSVSTDSHCSNQLLEEEEVSSLADDSNPVCDLLKFHQF